MINRIGHTANILTEKWKKKIFQYIFQTTLEHKPTDPSTKKGNPILLNPLQNSDTDLCCSIGQETKNLVCICKAA